jgi:hypothetical protein
MPQSICGIATYTRFAPVNSSLPAYRKVAEKELMRKLAGTYGKTWHTWHTDQHRRFAFAPMQHGARPGEA